MPSKGISVHIGLNHVDPAAYNGWDGALSGCINDATDMKCIAEQLGYSATLLTDSDATADNVIAAIGKAAKELGPTDILFITYSGHGGQVADVNGDEDDGQDETWVLYDRQLIDDELYALWAQFVAGVRIIMLSDSCHSGTMARMVAVYNELAATPAPKDGVDQFAALRAPAADIFPRRVAASKPGMRAMAPRPPEPSRVKLMPSDVRAVVNTLKRSEIAARQYVAGSAERAAIGASVILISGCQDNQLSLDGTANGLFTEKLKSVWNDGTFAGGYKDFANAIIAEMPEKQQPNYYSVGTPNAAFEAQAPFAIEAPRGTTSTSTSTTTSTSTSAENGVERPLLKRGDKGVYVKTLQEYLLNWRFNVEVDAIFGPRTEGAVRSFQSAHQLDPSGIVDARTWDALD